MAPCKHKLIYFDAPGLAEPIRWMFAYKKVDFDDHRLKELPTYLTNQPTPDWDALKDKTPYGTVPVLEMDGKYLGETHAIARYVASEIGLAGANSWDAAQADSILTYLASESGVWFNYVRETNPEKKQNLLQTAVERTKKMAATLEKILTKNKTSGGPGFLVGKCPTAADFVVASFLDVVEMNKPGVLKEFTLLSAHRQLVRDLPGVKEYIDKHAAHNDAILAALQKSFDAAK